MLGYTMAIYQMIISTILCELIYIVQFSTLPWFYQLIPTFSFVRSMQFVSHKCLDLNCYTSFSDIEFTEFRVSLAMLYIHALLYAFLAWYLNQIIPQTYGVPKKWNFLCKQVKRRKAYDFDEIGDLEEDRENN